MKIRRGFSCYSLHMLGSSGMLGGSLLDDPGSIPGESKSFFHWMGAPLETFHRYTRLLCYVIYGSKSILDCFSCVPNLGQECLQVRPRLGELFTL